MGQGGAKGAKGPEDPSKARRQGGGGAYYNYEAQLKKQRAEERAKLAELEKLSGADREKYKAKHFYKKAPVDPKGLSSWAACDLPAKGPCSIDDDYKDPILILQQDVAPRFPRSALANRVISLHRGDIVTLQCDGIVNAANEGLGAGGGICGAIHSAAGCLLEEECETYKKDAVHCRCATGQTVVTGGYRLPAKHVLHTVGPTKEDHDALRSCYRTTLDKAVEHGMQSVALCCVSTGIFGFPLLSATHTALDTVRSWIDENGDKVPRIVFVVFLAKELDVYQSLLPSYFPRDGEKELAAGEEKPKPPGPEEKKRELRRQARAQGLGLWEYKDQQEWKLYAAADERIIEEAYQSGKVSFQSKVIGSTTTLNRHKDTMQINFKPGEGGCATAVQWNTYYKDPKKTLVEVRRVPPTSEDEEDAVNASPAPSAKPSGPDSSVVPAEPAASDPPQDSAEPATTCCWPKATSGD